VSSCF